jgi:hypothetical protein
MFDFVYFCLLLLVTRTHHFSLLLTLEHAHTASHLFLHDATGARHTHRCAVFLSIVARTRTHFLSLVLIYSYTMRLAFDTHTGVLEAMREKGLSVDYIAGCSQVGAASTLVTFICVAPLFHSFVSISRHNCVCQSLGSIMHVARVNHYVSNAIQYSIVSSFLTFTVPGCAHRRYLRVDARHGDDDGDDDSIFENFHSSFE